PACSRAAGSGQLSVSEYQTALRTLLQQYPTFRGIMTWSTNWDETQNNAFVTGMRSTINTYGSNAFAFSGVSANVSSAEIGDTATWNASVSNASGSVQYKFDLYKNGSKIVTGSYGSSSSYSYTFTSAGSYNVEVSAKCGSDVVTGSSSAITVTAPPLSVSSITADKSGTVSAGTAIRYTATAAGGTAPLQYSFSVYKNGSVISTGSYSSSNTFNYTPTTGGQYSVKVTVKDAANLTASATSSLIFVTEDLAISSISVSKSGSNTTFTVNSNGGTGGNKYSVYVYANGVIYAKSVRSDSATFTTANAPSGTYTVRAYVQDNSGTMVALSKTVN
ncbi:MAG: hypothetical protein IJL87_00510, partial [Clostridia bacterium]|nr:hypothetical protein [Clostridia bacterium]